LLFNMAGEAPRRERVARPLVEGRVGGVRRDERGLARAVDLRGRPAPRAVAAAVVLRQAQEVRREQALELGRRRRRLVAQTNKQEELLGARPGDVHGLLDAAHAGAGRAAEPRHVRVVIHIEDAREARRAHVGELGQARAKMKGAAAQLALDAAVALRELRLEADVVVPWRAGVAPVVALTARPLRGRCGCAIS